ncbi:MAG: hypothetical protein V4750_13635 [Pseudomonadota bacterium]
MAVASTIWEDFAASAGVSTRAQDRCAAPVSGGNTRREPTIAAMNLPRALPWLVAASAAVAILASVGALPAPLVFAFKPLTTLLILAFAWPRQRRAAAAALHPHRAAAVADR